MKRRKFLELFGCSCCSFVLSSCSTAPITDRRQLKIIPESTLNRQAAQIYERVKKNSKLIDDNKDFKEIKSIGQEIEYSVSSYFNQEDLKDPTRNFQWEYILIDNDKIKNAWAMPGGKIAVYSGILEVTKNTNGLAAVMGHEISHAVAKHSIERASRSVLLNIGTSIADIATGGKISQASRSAGVDVAGMLRTFGIDNPFNRKQESEADYLGLIFSSLSGFDIRESVKLWERMKEANKGQEPPEWMSTHPSSSKRIKSLKKWITEVTIKYPPIKKS